MRIILGIVLGGILIAGSFAITGYLEAWNILRPATFTDGLLVETVILLSILVVKGMGRGGGRRNGNNSNGR